MRQCQQYKTQDVFFFNSDKEPHKNEKIKWWVKNEKIEKWIVNEIDETVY